ncbi:peptidoglycan DD-metalloendopeptidase family protein [Fulvivirga ligni]|uniref:peptidoglycan DD-metalloendopeptidase family protein n=1 Tax=Fulvivirga ligni TaxID=2904246 RepID=UPI001F38A8CA|nr:peptidoglycan DD-metalloendopeptidase family protein [Fulvivirga ligni]UII19232.1 peptidoglycan DD-metalloendopeptidase family protein [Fulvivirga ligni]
MTNFEKTLKSYQTTFASIMPYDLNKERLWRIDLSSENTDLLNLNLSDNHLLSKYIFGQISRGKYRAAIGGYGEDRIIYRMNHNFAAPNDEARSIHLGIDIWDEAGTAIYSPLDGKIHSLQNNDLIGDYGPTIIMEHELDSEKFYLLYGHLSKTSLDGKSAGQSIKKGEQIATLGAYDENVHWPPHLHFQLIRDLDGKSGDYPGVAKPSEKIKYLENCPDPNWILGVDALSK